jgi:cytochrome P450
MQSMTPRRLASRREEWRVLCQMYVERLGAETKPEIIEHFSTPLAYDAILGIFGAPLELRPIYDAVARTRKAAFRLGGLRDVDAWFDYESALVDFRNALESIYETVDPDTVIGSLLHPAPDQKRFSDDELFSIIMLFIAAGIENMFVLIPMTLFDC